MFKRSVTVEIPRNSSYDTAKEYLGPAFVTAKDSGSHALQTAMTALVPVVAAAAPAVAAAKSKGVDLLNSDAAHEARDRATLMLAAAKGQPVVAKRRRWPLVMMFFALGGAIGAAITTWFQRVSEMPPGTSYAEESHAGPKVDLTHPLTESEPQPVNVLSDVTDDDGERVGDYSDGRATF